MLFRQLPLAVLRPALAWLAVGRTAPALAGNVTPVRRRILTVLARQPNLAVAVDAGEPRVRLADALRCAAGLR